MLKPVARSFLCSLMVLTATAGPSSAVAADPFLSPPGVRERALGGATGALSGTPSSIWHNPALLAEAQEALVGELHFTPERDREHRLKARAGGVMLGALLVNPDKWIGTVATGLYFYTPQSIRYWVDNTGIANTAYGEVSVNVQTLAVPYAIAFANSGLSVGGTLEVLGVNADNSQIRYRDHYNDVLRYDIDEADQIGFSASLGVRYTALRFDSGSLRLGGVWRLPATDGANVDADYRPVRRLLPGKPSGQDVSIGVLLTPWDGHAMELGASFGTADWGRAGETQRYGLGLEYRHSFAEGLLQAGEVAWRVGTARYRSSASEDWMDWPDGNTLSLGAGVAFVGGWSLELALERRSETRDAGREQQNFLSLGLGYRY